MAAPHIDPGVGHDACGVGFIAALDRAPSYRMTRLAAECLRRLDHRGARAADGTGDGSGLLTQVPHRLIRRELGSYQVDLPAARIGVVMCFLPPMDAALSRSLITESLEAEGLRILLWRSVPVDPSVLGEHARAVLPLIEQAIVTGEVEGDEFERALYLARKRIEREANPGLSIPSASGRTVVYKGLFTATDIAGFYWDLRGFWIRDELCDIPSALLHQHPSLLGECSAFPDPGPQR